MRKILPVFTALLLLFAASCAFADCAIPGGINIDNETGAEIKAIYIAHAGTGEWSQNILETGAVIKTGHRGAIPFDRSAVPRIWDLKAVDKKGREHRWDHLALYNIYDLKLLKEGQAEYYEIRNAT